MKPFARTLAFAACSALAACGSDMSPLSVTEFRAVELENGLCSASATSVTALSLDTSRGVSGVGIVLGVQLKNDLTANPNTLDGRLDSHAVIIDSVSTTFRVVGGSAAAPAAVTAPASVRIDPQGTADMVVHILPVEAGTSIFGAESGTLVATVTFKGTLASGGSIESIPRSFPFNLCQGCIRLACEADTINAETGLPDVAAGFRRVSCGAEGLSTVGSQQCVATEG